MNEKDWAVLAAAQFDQTNLVWQSYQSKPREVHFGWFLGSENVTLHVNKLQNAGFLEIKRNHVRGNTSYYIRVLN